jgi:hypothetical protein
MSDGWSIRMKNKLILAACTALLPTLVSAQNLQVKDCRTLEAAGNFIEQDEVLANGLVCKIVKAKPDGSAAAQPSKKDSDLRAKLALLGIIEPEEVSLQEPHAKPHSGPAAITPEPPVKSAHGGTAVRESSAAAPQNAPLESDHVLSVAEVARAYQSRRQTDRKPEDQVVTEPPATPGVKSVIRSASATSRLPAVPMQSSNIPARISADKPAVAMEPKPEAPPVTSVPAAPAPTTASEAQPALEVTLITAPRASALAAPAIEKAQSAAKTAAIGSEPSPAAKPGLSPQVVAPAAATGVSQPEMKTRSFDPRDHSSRVDKPEVKAAIPEPEPDSSSERSQAIKLGIFEAPKDSAAETRPQMPVDPFGAPPGDLAIHEPHPGCARVISLGTMERDRLVLAIPDWAMTWLEKNQRRFPGVCFADSPLAGVPNYLIVFFTTGPPASQADVGSKAPVSPSGSKVSSGGTFTTSFGSTWHYTYDNAVTTTVTTAWTERIPQSQPVQTLYATAYTEQGIPISQRWPGQAKGHEKETNDKNGRKHDALSAAVRLMSDLLGEMMADLAAH